MDLCVPISDVKSFNTKIIIIKKLTISTKQFISIFVIKFSSAKASCDKCILVCTYYKDCRAAERCHFGIQIIVIGIQYGIVCIEMNPQVLFVSESHLSSSWSNRTNKNVIFSIPVKPMQFIFVL